MTEWRLVGTRIGGISSAGVLAAVLAHAGATAADPPPAACNAWDVEYALNGSLQLSDTPMGAGNGTYRVGPGKVVLRFEERGGATRVAMRSYEMPEHFVVRAKELFWGLTVKTDAVTRATPAAACGEVAQGVLTGQTLRWTTQTTGYRTDGTLLCDGSLCGSSGAPPRGISPLRIGPSSVLLGPFEFDRTMQTFTMASTFVSRTQAPPQTAHLALSGREVRRTCASAEPCP